MMTSLVFVRDYVGLQGDDIKILPERIDKLAARLKARNNAHTQTSTDSGWGVLSPCLK